MDTISTLSAEVSHRSGQQVELCYHCHKCTAGCPAVTSMSYGPDRLLRMVSLDEQDPVLRSRDIWLCAGCFTCTTRCPNEIDIAAVMDALRQVAVARHYPPGVRDALLFHRLYVEVIRLLGRSYEAAILGLFKLRAQQPLMNDMGAGLKLFLRGKVPLLPEGTKTGREVRKLFERSQQ